MPDDKIGPFIIESYLAQIEKPAMPSEIYFKSRSAPSSAFVMAPELIRDYGEDSAFVEDLRKRNELADDDALRIIKAAIMLHLSS